MLNALYRSIVETLDSKRALWLIGGIVTIWTQVDSGAITPLAGIIGAITLITGYSASETIVKLKEPSNTDVK